MSQDDISYYHYRAEEEITRASEATDPRTVAFHYSLANLYLDRVFPDGGAGAGADHDGTQPS